MTYVDGFLTPVPNNKVDAYKEMASKAGAVWMEYGALAFMECMADDVPEGKVTDFYRAVNREEGETVFFSYIVYKSREDRDAINKKVMDDPRIKDQMDPKAMPFDGMRMMWGGFKPVVELSK